MERETLQWVIEKTGEFDGVIANGHSKEVKALAGKLRDYLFDAATAKGKGTELHISVKTKAPIKAKPLTSAEEEILKALKDLGEATSKDLVHVTNRPKGTVLCVLSVLNRKGLVNKGYKYPGASVKTYSPATL